MSTAKTLLDQIVKTFSLSELQAVALDLHLIYDDLGGDRISQKAAALLLTCAKLERLEELQAVLEEERPKKDWRTVTQINLQDWDSLLDQEQLRDQTIYTDGGAAIMGNVEAGENVVGRDFNQTIIHNHFYAKENPDPKPTDPLEQFAQMPTSIVPQPGEVPSNSLLPHRHNQNFVGREKELRTAAWLISGRGDTQAAAVAIAATGLGGIGKTQLAAEFCHRYGRYFAGGVFWLNFDSEENGRSDIAQCAGRLNDAWSNLDFEQQIQQVQQAWKENVPRLLVFDNIEDHNLLDRYLPTTGDCRVLLTSRKGNWEQSGLNVTPLPLKTLGRDESKRLLQKLANRLKNDDEGADAIAKELGDFPLALHLAGSFLQKYHRNETVEKYLTKLRSFDLMGELGKQAERIENGPISPTDHTWHIARTFEMSYSQIRQSESDSADDLIKWTARRLLARAAMLAPGEPIPADLLFATFQPEAEADKPLFEPDEYQLQDGLNLLSQLGLIEPAEFGAEQQPAVLIHRLTNAYTTHSAEIEDSDLAQVESSLNSAVYRLGSEGYPRKLIPYQPHLRFVIQLDHNHQDNLRATLMNNLGEVLRLVGDYAGAKPYYEQALAITKKILGEWHPETATSLNNLGLLLKSQGDFAEAKLCYKQALAIRKKVLGERHPDTTQSLNNLGALLKTEGDTTGAKPYYEQALAINKEVLGERHPDTALSLNNLGLLLKAEGDTIGAKPYYEQALAINKEVLGERHPNTALSLNNLGALLQAEGDTAGAKPYFEQALDIRQEVLGEQHPDTAQSLNNLAVLAYYQNDFATAADLMRQALDIRESVLGPDHPNTISSRNSLAAIEAKLSGS